MKALAIELDGVLGDTRPLWRDWLEDAARRYRSIAPLDPGALPEDRGAADAEVSAAVRTLAAKGQRLGVFTDAPESLARIALSQLGVDRRIEALETGEDALRRLEERFGPDLTVVRERSALHLELTR